MGSRANTLHPCKPGDQPMRWVWGQPSLKEQWRWLDWEGEAPKSRPGGSGKEPACQCRPCVRSLGQEDPLEEGMASHSSLLAWRIPWTKELGRLFSIRSQRVGHAPMPEYQCPCLPVRNTEAAATRKAEQDHPRTWATRLLGVFPALLCFTPASSPPHPWWCSSLHPPPRLSS